MVKIFTPTEGFRGTVAGVEFTDGQGETDDERALAYFERKGYGIGEKPSSDEDAPEPPDPRDLSTVHGPQLRDAAVDPAKEDFLPPINAGKANPHGPKVVAPEIHGSPDQRVTPGDVAVDDTDAQEAKETAHAKATVQDDGDRAPHVEAFLDRNAEEVIADVGSLADGDRSAAIKAEEAGKGRVTVLRALRGEEG